MRLCTAAFLCSAALSSAEERIAIGGPADVLDRLTAFREALARWHPDLRLEWSAYEGGASLSPLFDGSVDLLLSSRAIEPRERELASRLSLQIEERVAGLDGVAVVVHKENLVESLTLEQIQTLFSGRIVGWYGFGGRERSVRLLAPAPESGEEEALTKLLLRAGFALSPAADPVFLQSKAVAEVAADPRAVALVSMSLDRSAVRTVPLKGSGSGDVALPTASTLERSLYPLSNPLWLYSRGADEGLRRVLASWLSSDGQREIGNAGFAPLFADRAFQRTLPAREKSRGASVTRIPFAAGAVRLDSDSERALSELSTRAKEVWITGQARIEEGRPPDPRLSEERARAVEQFLRGQGVTVAGIEWVTSLERQVEVWWISRR